MTVRLRTGLLFPWHLSTASSHTKFIIPMEETLVSRRLVCDGMKERNVKARWYNQKQNPSHMLSFLVLCSLDKGILLANVFNFNHSLKMRNCVSLTKIDASSYAHFLSSCQAFYAPRYMWSILPTPFILRTKESKKSKGTKYVRQRTFWRKYTVFRENWKSRQAIGLKLTLYTKPRNPLVIFQKVYIHM